MRASLAILIAACAVTSACSEDNPPTESKPDAVNNVDGAADSTLPDTTIADSGHDTTVNDSTIDSATVDSAVDSVVEAEAEADAGLCPAGQWFDFELGSCADCPETPRTLVCSDFELGLSKYDASTTTVTLNLNTDIAQMVSGTVDYTIVHSSGATDTHTATATFSGNDLSAVLTVPGDATEIDVTSETITDACGTTSSPFVNVTITTSTDGGPPDSASFGCPVTGSIHP